MATYGAWRSLVAHLLWEQGAAGSNPVTPTRIRQLASSILVSSTMGELLVKTAGQDRETRQTRGRAWTAGAATCHTDYGAVWQRAALGERGTQVQIQLVRQAG